MKARVLQIETGLKGHSNKPFHNDGSMSNTVALGRMLPTGNTCYDLQRAFAHLEGERRLGFT
jgi:hypothetical protein